MTTQMVSEQVDFKQVLDHAIAACERGLQAKAKPHLLDIYNRTVKSPFLVWDDCESVGKLGKAFLMSFHFEIFEEEVLNIRMAHFSYVYLSRHKELLENENSTEYFDCLKSLLFTLRLCDDNFTNSVAHFYLPKNKHAEDSDVSFSITAAQAIISAMQYIAMSDVLAHELYKPTDKYLALVCKEIELRNSETSQRVLMEAEKMMPRLYHFITEALRREYIHF